MSKGDLISKGNGFDLLDQFEHILDSDPLIDEVGFIHPSQFVILNKEAESSKQQSKDEIWSSDNSLDHEDSNFWNRDHKLGISTHVLLPLYKAAKDAFMDSIRQYKIVENLPGASEDEMDSPRSSAMESEVMKHSKALLLLSCDFGTAWNSRKLILSKKRHMSLFSDELLFSGLVLSYSPKSEQAWCHRRWVIKMIAGQYSAVQEIVGKESDLVEKIAEV